MIIYFKSWANKKIFIVRQGFIDLVNDICGTPKRMFHASIFALSLLSTFYDPQIFYACFLVVLGLLVGKVVGPYALYCISICLLPFLRVNVVNKIEFYFTDTNYTAYILFLLIAPLVIYRSGLKRDSGWLNYLLVMPALVPLSRGVIVAVSLLLLYANKRYAKYILFALLAVAPVFYGFFFHDRAAGSDTERFYIWKQILEGGVFYEKGAKFVNLYVHSPYRSDNLVHLHNTPVTWFFHVSHSVVSMVLYVLLLFCVRVLSFLLLIPSFFLTVAPGPFYLLFGLSLGASNPFRRT